MDNIDYAIKQLVDDKADHAFIRNCVTANKDLFEFYNTLALRIARLFLEESMSFDDADTAVNNLNSIWLDDAIKYDYPEPAYSVYLAFDAGEYSVDDKDHIEIYTRPELRRLLNEA
ncbi:MAG: hypothetical protein ACR2O5_00275 [Thiogranum sp.]